MKNGFRQQAQPGRKERLRGLDVEVKNTAMSVRISQMMTQQLMQNMKNMQEDLGRAFGIINELQYKILAVQKVSGFDLEKMNEVANEQRLKDFNEASDKEDQEEGFTVGTLVDENSVVILTSTTAEKDRGLFRSKIKLATCGVPDLVSAFTGREVGAKALVQLNGVEHEVELLGIRQPKPNAEGPAAGATASDESVSADADAGQAQGGAVATEVVGNA
jgi:hypothetical protein